MDERHEPITLRFDELKRRVAEAADLESLLPALDAVQKYLKGQPNLKADPESIVP